MPAIQGIMRCCLCICLCIVQLLAYGSNICAVILAWKADHMRSTASVVSDSEKTYWYCVYHSDKVTRYGISAAVLLLFCSVVYMVFICCMDVPGRAFHILYFLIIGVLSITAEACILAGTVISAQHTKDRTPFADDPPSCKTVPKGLFQAGYIFSFLLLGNMSSFKLGKEVEVEVD